MGNSKMTIQQEMFNEIVAYLKHINFAKNCFDAYIALYNNVQKDETILNYAVGFFTVTRYALSKCLLIELSKLFCGSGKERTVYKLINKAEANNNAFTDGNAKVICKVYKDKFDTDLKPIICMLKSRRDRDLTHNDPAFFAGEINPAQINYISPEECGQLISVVFGLCEELLACLPAFEPVCLETGADDIDNLIQALCSAEFTDK